jgi:hypothetical protein
MADVSAFVGNGPKSRPHAYEDLSKIKPTVDEAEDATEISHPSAL